MKILYRWMENRYVGNWSERPGLGPVRPSVYPKTAQMALL